MNFKTKKLSECCDYISDGDHLPPPKAERGVPFITISNIDSNNEISFENTMHVPQSYYKALTESKKARVGDILYSVVGSFGKPVYIDCEKEFVFQRHIAILKPKKTLNAQYLYYCMLNPIFYKLVDRLAIGCSQRTVTLDTLRNITIKLPEIEIQNNIVHILSTIDKKIKMNNKINDNLAAQSLMVA